MGFPQLKQIAMEASLFSNQGNPSAKQGRQTEIER
jgi:hypothetical protein